MYGGMAALGALAYRAYGDWQRKQAPGPPRRRRRHWTACPRHKPNSTAAPC